MLKKFPKQIKNEDLGQILHRTKQNVQNFKTNCQNICTDLKFEMYLKIFWCNLLIIFIYKNRSLNYVNFIEHVFAKEKEISKAISRSLILVDVLILIEIHLIMMLQIANKWDIIGKNLK